MKIEIRQLMTASNVVFGTSGVRGQASQMTDEICAAYSLAFLQALGLAGLGRKVALGLDLRPSSPAVARACAAGIRQAGCEVDFCGVLPTPALALYAMAEVIPAMMITGSHIPFDRNGIKFYRPEGEISKTDEASICNAWVNLQALEDGVDLPAVNEMALEHYLLRYTQLFPRSLLAGQRVGLYEHSSAARDCLRTLLTALGAEVVSLARMDVFVPIDTESISDEDQQRGHAWAAEYGLDAIVSTDGDGDRPLIADETGTWLRGDIVGFLCARFLGADTVVTPVNSNTAIEASGFFEQVVRTRIGSPYVIAGMEQALAAGRTRVVGFEANGGVLVGGDFRMADQTLVALPTRDAVLPILALLALAGDKGCSISGLLAEVPLRFTASDRLQNFDTKRSQILIASLLHDADARKSLWGDICGEVVRYDQTDGLRLIFEDGEIVHLRPSGNAPEMRCYAEAETTERAKELVADSLARVSRWGFTCSD
jgi:phosphomannomutase